MRGRRLVFPEVRQVAWEDFDPPATPDPHTVVAESLCSLISVGTELAIYAGTHVGFSLPNPPFPLIPNRPGYALVGRVIAIGAEVKGIEIGQRVLMEAAHGTHGVVDTRQSAVLPLPDSVSDADGALIRLASVALTAVRLAPAHLGESVAVIGLGLVGHLAAQLYRLNGARPVIGLDRIESRLALARAHGLVALNTEHTNAKAEAFHLPGGRGPEIVVEATGNPAAIPLALDLVAEGGRVVLLGSPRGRIEIDPYSHIHRKGVTVIGAHERTQIMEAIPHGRWSKLRNLSTLSDLFAAGDLRSEGLITHHITPLEALSIYDALAEKPYDYLGVVIDWQKER